MTRRFLSLVFVCLAACPFGANISAQTTYFQQEVNYRINVTLDDVAHTVAGDIEIEYRNNAPQALDSIFFHLWGNAFSKTGTAYDEQKLRTGSSKFYFSEEKDKGGYSGLSWTVDGQAADFSLQKNDPDIGVLRLPKAITPGGKVTIRTPFTLQIPASFSRLGHVGTSYQLTQWYPKPAVFDRKGWHPMPYLDMGEFYSEFGSFDVTITLPENYVVGASGVCQTASELEFLRSKISETQDFIKNGFPEKDTFPASSPVMKTLRYVANDVHDFAWFADKRFHVLHDEAVLATPKGTGGKKVDCWAMFTNKEAKLWIRGAEYVRRAVEFYSEHVGEYPWPQATAVHSALSAGGGMEYPMITVIGNSGNARALDDVITHEVGHNWFYGILASDERTHPWMDEGLNTYYEYRYMRQYYGSRLEVSLPKFLTGGTDFDLYELVYLFNARRNLDQAPDTHSDHFTSINYGTSSYIKPGSVLGHLEGYLGTEAFDRAMKKYYETWKFRHPYPEDFRQVLEAETGKDLGWLFDGYLFSTKKLDYSLQLASKAVNGWQVQVRNDGEIAAPFPVSGLKNGEVVKTVWFEPIPHEAIVNFPAGDFDEFVIDAEHATLDVWRKNNHLRTKGVLPKMEPVKISFLGPVENSRRTTLNFFPAAAWNKYDGPMLGLGLHNGLLPARKFEWQWLSLYGFESKEVVGLAAAKYHVFPKSEKIRKITFGLSSQAFNYRALDSLRTEQGFGNTDLQYQTLVPSVKIELRRSLTDHFFQTIELRSIALREEGTVFVTDSTGTFYRGDEFNDRFINQLTWTLGDRRVLNPYQLAVTLEQSGYDDPFGSDDRKSYIRANVEWKSSYTYAQGRSFDFRFFAGGFLQNDFAERGFVAPGAYNLTGQGFNDYRYDELFFGRTEASGLWSRQISEREGGMKIALGSPYSEGRSNRFVVAVNLKSDLPQDLPGKLPLRPYFDLGYYDDARPISSGLSFADQLWWQGGFSLEFFKGVFAVHLPVVNSKNVGDLYDQSGRSGFFKRFTFQLDLRRLSPWAVVDELEF